MAEQLSLELVQPVRYAACNYVLHSGARDQLRDAEGILLRTPGSLVFIELGPRSGKTHLSVYLTEKLACAAKVPLTIEGPLAQEWFESVASGSVELGQNGVVLIDDADLFLTQIAGLKLTGLFVNVVETLKKRGVGLVFLSAHPLESFGCEPNVTSRVRAGLMVHIAPPGDEDLDTLLDSITKQRGLLLTDAKRAYLLKRVARDIPGLVETVERLGESGDGGSPSTSFHAISEIVKS